MEVGSKGISPTPYFPNPLLPIRCQKDVTVIKEPFIELIVRRILVSHFLDVRSIKVENLRAGVGQQDGRVGGDDELGVARFLDFLQHLQELDLACG